MYALAEAGKRVFPELHVDMSADAAFLLRLLATKPGASKGVVRGSNEEWQFGFGTLIFQHGEHWYFAARTPQRSFENGSPNDGGPINVTYRFPNAKINTDGALKIRALTGGEKSLRELLQSARDTYMVKGEVGIHNWEGHWEYLEGKPPRPLNTVAVQGGVADEMLADIKSFLADEAWYKRLHVPYRRGYLLYGPPGSGKSTLAGALAAEAGLNICVLSLSDKNLNDNNFVYALRQMPKKSILLLEDVDAVNAQTQRRSSAGVKRNEVESLIDGEPLVYTTQTPPGTLTLAGILNALDGLTTPSGMIVMMTTNHPEKLDPALVRPGRVDFKAEIGLATKGQAAELYRRFFPDKSRELGWDEWFAAQIEDGVHSPAELQEHLVRHRYDPEGAIHFGAESC